MMESPNILPFAPHSGPPSYGHCTELQYTMADCNIPAARGAYMDETHYPAPDPYAFNQPNPVPFYQYFKFKPEYTERQELGSGHDPYQILPSPQETNIAYTPHPPSSVRSDSEASASQSSNRNFGPIGPITSEFLVPYDAQLNELMGNVQQCSRQERREATQQPMSLSKPSIPVKINNIRPRRRHFCEFPGCDKSFVKKAQLEMHERVHTGARPYVCGFEGCKLAFTQLGNLKTHMRRHTGERPFACKICGRRFAQGGNVRVHERIHQKLKPFICRLDNCNKTFSQLSNMKAHQNNCHKSTLEGLVIRFTDIFIFGKEVPSNDREMFEYFFENYLNAKGRKGHNRTVAHTK